MDLSQKRELLFILGELKALLDAELSLIEPVEQVLDVREIPPAVGVLRA
jgi:hypothetical protein